MIKQNVPFPELNTSKEFEGGSCCDKKKKCCKKYKKKGSPCKSCPKF